MMWQLAALFMQIILSKQLTLKTVTELTFLWHFLEISWLTTWTYIQSQLLNWNKTEKYLLLGLKCTLHMVFCSVRNITGICIIVKATTNLQYVNIGSMMLRRLCSIFFYSLANLRQWLIRPQPCMHPGFLVSVRTNTGTVNLM